MIVVEHDEDAILTADYVVDIGPGAGVHGGQIIAQGTPDEIMADPGQPHRRNTSPARARSRAEAAPQAPTSASAQASSARAATT